MTASAWNYVLHLLDENETRFTQMRPSPPGPKTQFWRESAHRTLGHLTACQAAWLPLMRAIKDGATSGSVPIRPDPLYTKLRLNEVMWDELLQRFKGDREEWRRLLREIDLRHELRTETRVHTAQSLTKRMVSHEERHLNDLHL